MNYIKSFFSNNTNQTDNSDTDTEPDTEPEYEIENKPKYTLLTYEEQKEIEDELELNEYNYKKDFGNWLNAKTYIKSINENKNNTEFFFDILANYFSGNSDDFNNIKEVLIEKDEMLFRFNSEIGKYIVENLKIPSYKSKSYFSGLSGLSGYDENVNKWVYKIVVITNKGFYCANRLIDETHYGCH